MSAAHEEAFTGIRREHDNVVAALRAASKSRKRGYPGYPGFDPKALPTAIATAGDAYALLLIATAEGFMRDYLRSEGRSLPASPTLDSLVNMVRKEHDRANPSRRISREQVAAVHDLRVRRNRYAHGHGIGVFSSVPDITSILGRFFHYLP